MSKIRVRGEAIRHYILEHLDKHPADIMKVTSEHFDVTRQAVNKHLASLVHEKAIIPSGNTCCLFYLVLVIEHVHHL